MLSVESPVGRTIRPEQPADIGAIHSLVTSAFDSPLEANLIDRLREDGDLVLSLVAQLNGKTIGYAGFSRLAIEGRKLAATALAPVAVAKCHRRRGIATALVREGITQLEEAGEDLVFVLGDPPYYKRFGFDTRIASRFCAPWSGPAFMALALEQRSAPADRPHIVYPPAFETFG
jgi:putative acetyltransferase